MAEAKFHGVDLGWMQAQWRDCRDKAAQLAIFRDMVGKSVPVQEILDAVGEPEYCGPIDRTPKIVPEKGWIDTIAAKCAECGVPVFMKQSVKEIMGEDFRQEWPWEVDVQ